MTSTDDLVAQGDRLHAADTAFGVWAWENWYAIRDEWQAALRERDDLREQANLFAALVEEYSAENAALRVRAEAAEALLAEVNQRAIYPGGADLRVRVAAAVEGRRMEEGSS